MTTIDRYNLENSLRCRRLGALTRRYEPRPYRVPQETRRRIEQAIPEELISGTSLILQATQDYERDVEQRGIEALNPEENVYDTFCRERNAMFALVKAITKRRWPSLTPTFPAELSTTRVPLNLDVFDYYRYEKIEMAYRPSPHVIIRQGDEYALAVYRVVSKVTEDDHQFAYQDLSIYADAKAAEKAAGIEISKVGVCFVVMGRKANGYYDNPFTRRWRDRATGQFAWQHSYVDPAGKTKRLGKQWELQVLNNFDEIEEWIKMLEEDRGSKYNKPEDPWAHTFPEPVFHDVLCPGGWPWPTMPLTSLYQIGSETAEAPEAPPNWRACRFPDRCPMHAVCWEGEDPETSSKYLKVNGGKTSHETTRTKNVEKTAEATPNPAVRLG